MIEMNRDIDSNDDVSSHDDEDTKVMDNALLPSIQDPKLFLVPVKVTRFNETRIILTR